MGYNGSDKHKIALFENKQDKLKAGDNITLTPQPDGTVEISASGGGSGTVTDVLVDGQSVVNQDGEAEITMPTVPNNLGDLSDVNLSSPTDGQVLKYDENNQEWVNDDAGGGNVDDVKVNGISVIDTNKVAQVTSYKEITQAQYDALPASKFTDGILYCIKDTGVVEGEQFAPVIYSLEEREIGTWVDGKPLYTKTIDCGALPDTSTKSIPIDAGIEYIVSYDGFIYSTTDNTSQRPVPFPAGGSNDIRIDKSGTNLRIITFTNYWSVYNCFITIQYTKTADTAGSGSWGVNGIPKFLSGSTAPSSQLGSDGEIYVKTDGTSVEMVYYKIGGAWLPEFTDGDLVGY